MSAALAARSHGRGGTGEARNAAAPTPGRWGAGGLLCAATLWRAMAPALHQRGVAYQANRQPFDVQAVTRADDDGLEFGVFG